MVPIHKKVLIGQQQKHLIAVFSREKGAYGCEVFRWVHNIIFKKLYKKPFKKCTDYQTNILVLRPETPQVSYSNNFRCPLTKLIAEHHDQSCNRLRRLPVSVEILLNLFLQTQRPDN